MQFLPTELPGVLLIEPGVYHDARGLFLETYHQARYAKGGVDATFVQDNFSRSVHGTLRGLHAQRRHSQGKLVRVIRGEVFDVAVDVRRGSPSFGHWYGATLSGENLRQLYLPPGFMHGFCVLSDSAELSYKCTHFYDADDEYAVRWDDPDIGIDWPIDAPLLSARDEAAPRLKEIEDTLPLFEGS